MTIPSIENINGGMILGEIGDIHRFSSPSKLLAFTELDSSVYQSSAFRLRKRVCLKEILAFYVMPL